MAPRPRCVSLLARSASAHWRRSRSPVFCLYHSNSPCPKNVQLLITNSDAFLQLIAEAALRKMNGTFKRQSASSLNSIEIITSYTVSRNAQSLSPRTMLPHSRRSHLLHHVQRPSLPSASSFAPSHPISISWTNRPNVAYDPQAPSSTLFTSSSSSPSTT